jgi:hypothetical protein
MLGHHRPEDSHYPLSSLGHTGPSLSSRASNEHLRGPTRNLRGDVGVLCQVRRHDMGWVLAPLWRRECGSNEA